MTNAKRSCVLDIETIPDRHGRILAGRRGTVPIGSPLHAILNVSLLTFTLGQDFELANLDLVSFHADEYDEPDILRMTERVLADVANSRGLLVTFNGRRHDLPVLRMRQLRWWQCANSGIRGFAAGEGDHMDVMATLAAGGTRFATLADACGAVGFSIFGMTQIGRTTETPKALEKCELDVVGTAVLMLHLLAERARSDVPLRRGMPVLGDYLRTVAARRPHLEHFALNPLLRPDALAWGASEPMSTSRTEGKPRRRTGTSG